MALTAPGVGGRTLAVSTRLKSWWRRNRPYSTTQWVGALANLALGALVLLLLFYIAKAALDFLIVKSAPFAADVATCRVAAGACWPFVADKANQFLFGRYPEAELWRAVFAMLAAPVSAAAAFVLARGRAVIGPGAAFMAGVAAGFLALAGGLPGLPEVPMDVWGGLTLSLLVAYTGMAAALPLGILLALGRVSSWPVPRVLSIGFIEFWRGVPLVTVLFLASVMLPLFLPEGVTINKLARALIVIAVFASAYMAEVVRGGLLSIPSTQYEAAEALGLSYGQTLRLAVLPQALRNALPGIVGTFIGLLKDTTLVLIIGLFDFLGMIQLAAADPAWAAPSTAMTGYVFAALVFWCLCFGLSRLGALIEARTKRGRV
jgi:general L-amino acid transport system permease protein